MLLELAQWAAQEVRAFSVFNYITLRAVLATLTALVISFIVGPVMIRRLTAYRIGQAVRDDGPQSHLTKAGTPTMGGALILVSIVVTTLLWTDLTNRYIWVVLAVTIGFGLIGWVDDYRKVVHRNPKGLPARAKLFWQSLIGLTAAVYLAFSTTLPAQTEFIVPFFKHVAYPLGVWGFILMTYFVIVGTSNAVNLTDGLDGLAIMPTVMVGSALGVFAYVAGHAVFSRYLGTYPRRVRADRVLRGAGRRWARRPLVQRLSRRGFHGRCRCVGAGRGTRHLGGDLSPGDRAVHYGRRVRGRDPVGDATGGFIQTHRQTHLPHGAAASPL